MCELPDESCPEIIRFAPAYIGAFRALVNETHEEFGFSYDPILDADLEDPESSYDTILLVLDRDEVVGSGAIRKENGVAEIKRFNLAPPYRRLGLGQQLLDRLLAAARDLGVERVRLDTAAHQERARRLYERNGFVAVGELEGPLRSLSILYELSFEGP